MIEDLNRKIAEHVSDLVEELRNDGYDVKIFLDNVIIKVNNDQ